MTPSLHVEVGADLGRTLTSHKLRSQTHEVEVSLDVSPESSRVPPSLLLYFGSLLFTEPGVGRPSVTVSILVQRAEGHFTKTGIVVSHLGLQDFSGRSLSVRESTLVFGLYSSSPGRSLGKG